MAVPLDILRLSELLKPRLTGDTFEGIEDPEVSGTPDLDAYRAHLSRIPQREDFKLSKFGNIASVLAGGLTGAARRDPTAGIELTHYLKDRPFKSALSDFSVEGAGLKESADIESRNLREAGELETRQLEMQRKRDFGDEFLRLRSDDLERKKLADIERAATEEEKSRIREDYNNKLLGLRGREVTANEGRSRAYADSIKRRGLGRQPKVPSATEQHRARFMAINRVLEENPDQGFEEFVTRDDNGRAIGIAHPGGSADVETTKRFMRFSSLLDKGIKSIGAGGDMVAPLEEEPEEEEDEYDIIDRVIQ